MDFLPPKHVLFVALVFLFVVGTPSCARRESASNVPSDHPSATVKSPAVDQRCDDGMVKVPAGRFNVGPWRQRKQEARAIDLPSFCIDRLEVTVARYQQCVAAGNCTAAQSDDEQCNAMKSDRANHPINCVDWYQAVAYCRWTKKRLPTSDEWEYAARGTDGREHPWGNELPTMKHMCWSDANHYGPMIPHQGVERRRTTCESGSFPFDVSPFGVADMGGNVSEWVADRVCDHPSMAKATCESDNRIARGLDYRSRYSEGLAAWGGNGPTVRTPLQGFRCADETRIR